MVKRKADELFDDEASCSDDSLLSGDSVSSVRAPLFVDPVVMGPKPDRPVFHANAVQWLLTYPHTDDVSHQQALDAVAATKKAGIKAYVVCREKHKDGDCHIHMYIKFDRRVRVRYADCFDFKVGDKLYHGNYQVARNAKKVISYCKKDGDFISKGVDVVDDNDWGKAVSMARDGNARAAFDYLVDTHPRDVLQRGSDIMKNLVTLAKPKYSSPYKLADFRAPALLCSKWETERTKRSIILCGPPGTGKTSWARSLGEHLFVSHLDVLSNFQPGHHKYIVFDDMAFTHLPRSTCIFLVDVEQERQIHVRYKVAIIPARTPRIFCTNTEASEIFSCWDAAMKRRCCVVIVPRKMF